MEIVIKGESKEIADLVVVLQGRQRMISIGSQAARTTAVGGRYRWKKVKKTYAKKEKSRPQ